jgi:hypothetical protein
MFLPSQPKTLFELLPALGEQTGYIDSIIDVDFPHISKNIITMWGSAECLVYIERTINYSHEPDRPIRQGFPLQVIIELQIALNEHMRQFPDIQSDFTHRKNDIWSF